MEKNSKLDLLPPGDTAADALGALARLTRHAKMRVLVAKRRYERTKGKTDEHNYMLAAQEYYYAAALSADFRKALTETLAAKHFEKSEKDDKLN
jgi:hypothetical protein